MERSTLRQHHGHERHRIGNRERQTATLPARRHHCLRRPGHVPRWCRHPGPDQLLGRRAQGFNATISGLTVGSSNTTPTNQVDLAGLASSGMPRNTLRPPPCQAAPSRSTTTASGSFNLTLGSAPGAGTSLIGSATGRAAPIFSSAPTRNFMQEGRSTRGSIRLRGAAPYPRHSRPPAANLRSSISDRAPITSSCLRRCSRPPGPAQHLDDQRQCEWRQPIPQCAQPCQPGQNIRKRHQQLYRQKRQDQLDLDRRCCRGRRRPAIFRK